MQSGILPDSAPSDFAGAQPTYDSVKRNLPSESQALVRNIDAHAALIDFVLLYLMSTQSCLQERRHLTCFSS